MPTSRRRGFGAVRKLPSGRHQASYLGPDGHRHPAPATFDTRRDAEAWLAAAQTAIANGDWRRPEPARSPIPPFGAYADAWLAGHTLRPRTRAEYRKLLDGHLRPAFGDQRIDDITPARVRVWHAGLAEVTGPTRRAHAYALLRVILNTAVADDVITANPCRVRGAGSAKRARKVKPATLAELEVIVAGMPEQWQAAVLIAAWCGLRFGELAELRRRDVDLEHRALRIRRAVTHVDGENVVGQPKSEAGVRDVSIPPHLVPVLRDHLAGHVARGRDALLFPAPSGEQMRSNSQMHRAFQDARKVAGRPDLRFHDLRHTGATLAAATGATLAELMHRLGHSTPQAALIYQHATADRDAAIAAALSDFASARVVELRPRKAN
jgi:integrase